MAWFKGWHVLNSYLLMRRRQREWLAREERRGRPREVGWCRMALRVRL